MTVALAVGDVQEFGPLKHILLLALAGDLGSDLSDIFEVVEDSSQFIITGLARVKLCKSRDLIKRWYGAAIIRRNARAWVADEEGEVELLQYLGWNDGRVAWLCFGSVRKWRLGAVGVSVRRSVGGVSGVMAVAIDTVSSLTFGADTTLWNSAQRWSNAGILRVGWGEVVGDVLNEETFSLILRQRLCFGWPSGMTYSLFLLLNVVEDRLVG